MFHLQVEGWQFTPSFRYCVADRLNVSQQVVADFQQGILLATVLASSPGCDCGEVTFEMREVDADLRDMAERGFLVAQVTYGVQPAAGMGTWIRSLRVCRDFDQAAALCLPPRAGAGQQFSYHVRCVPGERGVPEADR